MSDELESLFAEPAAEPDWSERAGVIGYIVEARQVRHAGEARHRARRRGKRAARHAEDARIDRAGVRDR